MDLIGDQLFELMKRVDELSVACFDPWENVLGGYINDEKQNNPYELCQYDLWVLFMYREDPPRNALEVWPYGSQKKGAKSDNINKKDPRDLCPNQQSLFGHFKRFP